MKGRKHLRVFALDTGPLKRVHRFTIAAVKAWVFTPRLAWTLQHVTPARKPSTPQVFAAVFGTGTWLTVPFVSAQQVWCVLFSVHGAILLWS